MPSLFNIFNRNASGELTQKEMSFLDHLEELRWHIVKILIGWILATIACGIYSEFIVSKLLLGPLKAVGLKSQVLAPYGIVLLYMQSVLICGFILSMPNTLYWLWRFIAPGLLPKERKYVSWLVAFTSLLFFGGVAFGYFVLIPTALDFFAGFGTQDIELNISIDRYISFVLALIVGAGLVFELPMISYTLSKIGFLTPAFMRHYRRHAIVTILIIAALVTPTPDIVTQLLLGIPMILLYEVSILISAVVAKKREQEIFGEPEPQKEPEQEPES
ncbi:MAG TPA: twin-arginine translocase subunit TatC [Bacteroidota bacterium]